MPKNDHLCEISQLFSKSETLQVIFERVWQAIRETSAFDTCRLFLLEPYQRLISEIEPPSAGTVFPGFGVGLVPGGFFTAHPELLSGEPARIDCGELDIPGPNGKPIHVFPIRIRNTPAGIFALTSHSGLPAIREELALVQVFLGFAALALEHQALVRESGARAETLARLLPITVKLTHSNKQADILQAIGESLFTLLETDHLVITLPISRGSSRLSWSRGLPSTALSRVFGRSQSLFPLAKTFQTWATAQPGPGQRRSPWQRLGATFPAVSAAIIPIRFESRILANVGVYFNREFVWTGVERELVEIFARHAGVALENSRLYGELEEAYLETVLTLAKALDIRDTYTASHSRRMADWAEGTARKFNCNGDEIKLIRWAALLHDIGKIGIPDAILRKAGPLTDEEWAIMKRHPELGAEIVSPVKQLRQVTPIIRAHQERFDGTGYPDGLAGEQIPLAARILTVVDAYGAMTDERVFRKARTHEEAVAELKRCAGKQFDRRVVEAFFELVAPGTRLSLAGH